MDNCSLQPRDLNTLTMSFIISQNDIVFRPANYIYWFAIFTANKQNASYQKMLVNNISSEHGLTIDNARVTQNTIMILLKIDVVIVDSVYFTLNPFMKNASNFRCRNSSIISLFKSTTQKLQSLTFTLPQCSTTNLAFS